jgi:hypothetical protein
MKWLVLSAGFVGISSAAAARECRPGDYVHGTWPATVLSRPCQKPIYLEAAELQGFAYPADCYCVDLRVITVTPYVPRSMISR